VSDEEIRDVLLDDIAPKGDAFGPLDDSMAYVARAIPGERVRLRIRKRRRNWIATELLEVLEPSEHRVEPRCPLFGQCAGCQLQHVAYPHQLHLKRRMVVAQLQRFGDFVDPPVRDTLGAADPWHYRNHARFTVRDGVLGFIRRFRREFLRVDQCPIMDTRINDVMATMQGKLAKASQLNVRVGAELDALMIQPRLDDAPGGLPTGQPHLFETLGGRSFRVSSASFFQVHRAQAEKLTELVAAAVTSAGESATVVDAYAGVGTFAALLADRVGKMIAIEQSGPAVEDAKLNVAGLERVEYVLGRTEELLGQLAGPIDAVILDPPRSGCLPAALEALTQLHPTVIAYVSCDPASLARDLRVLVDDGYVLESVQPVDMFPHTYHVECVATLRWPGTADDTSAAPK
jgi:23S rRNA (uracil1939-C5)-methyltransferase